MTRLRCEALRPDHAGPVIALLAATFNPRGDEGTLVDRWLTEDRYRVIAACIR